MRTLLSICFCLSILSTIQAQSPERIPYQAVIRNSQGELLADQAVSVRFQLRQSTVDGTVVYSETFNTNTTNIGLVNLEIGAGSPVQGTFPDIDWSEGPYFLEIGYDLDGGDQYTLMGTTQLVSVPYSLHSLTAARTVLRSKAQRDAMTDLAAGQLLFCQDCGGVGELQIYNGIEWTNMVGDEVVE